MKKLVISAPMCADRIIELFDGYSQDGIEIKYLSKNGMKLYFDINGIEGDEAVSMAKKMLRSTDWAKSLYFYVTME